MQLQPGDIITGYCRGVFGRDSYGEKIVIASGRDWVVVKCLSGVYEEGGYLLAQGEDVHDHILESQEEE